MAKPGTLTVRVLGDTKPFQKSMGKLGGIAKRGAQVAAVAFGAAAAKGITSFVGFERQMNEVFTLLPDISQDAMDDMTGQVKKFSKDFGVLPDQVVPALYQSLSAGVPQDNVFEFLETAQKAAKGGVTDLTTAVDGISSVVNAYGEDVVGATKASDLMFTAVRLGKTNFEQLSASLFNVTPIAAGLGVKFEDVTAGLAAMTAQGVPTRVASTQMRQLFVELSKAGGEAAGVFEDMAGKTFEEFVRGGGNTAEALAIMQEAAEKAGVPIQDMFGSVEAGAAALTLTGSDAFVDNIEEMGESAGATQDAFDQMMTGLGPIFDKIKAGIAVFLIDIGQRLAPLVESAMEKVGVAFAIASDWWEDHGPAITGKVDEVREAIMGWIDDVRPAIQSWVDDNLENVRKWWEDHGPTVVAAADAMRAGIVEAIDLIVDAVQFVVDEWDKFKVVLLAGIAVLIARWAALATAATASAATQAAAWASATATAAAAAAATAASMAAVIAVVGLVASAVVVSVALISKSWRVIPDTVRWVTTNATEYWDRFIRYLKTLPQKVADALSGLWDGVPSPPGGSGGFLGAIARATPGVPHDLFEGRARGGPVTAGRPYKVGEDGPELFVPGRSGTIVPNGRTTGGQQGGDTVYNITVNNPVGEPSEKSLAREARRIQMLAMG